MMTSICRNVNTYSCTLSNCNIISLPFASFTKRGAIFLSRNSTYVIQSVIAFSYSELLFLVLTNQLVSFAERWISAHWRAKNVELFPTKKKSTHQKRAARKINPTKTHPKKQKQLFNLFFKRKMCATGKRKEKQHFISAKIYTHRSSAPKYT